MSPGRLSGRVALRHRVDGPEDGRVLVLGNSLGTSLEMWDPFVEALGDAPLRVVRCDFRGQGGSPVPEGPYAIADLGQDVLGLLDELGIERFAYAGVSMGGMVAVWLAQHAADRVTHVVPCCTSAFLGDPAPWHDRMATVHAAGGTATIADAVVGRWLTEPYAEAHPEQVAALRAMLLASPAEGYVGCCAALAGLDLRDELCAITAPALVLGGAQDASIPPEHSVRLAEAIPGARCVVLDPAAHIPMAERPADVARLVLDHLEATT